MDKSIKASIQFPVLKISEQVIYSEVRKPTGLDFILLVLISDSKNRSDKLADVLKNTLEIPENLHYIFADRIRKLIDNKVLSVLSDFDFRPGKFYDYPIDSFELTPGGKKMFAEKKIPTGVNKEKEVPVYYNVALDKLLLSNDEMFSPKNYDLKPKPLDNCDYSVITPEFMGQFKCDRNIEDFLNLQKGKGLSEIKKDDIITQVVEIGLQNWVKPYPCDLNIKNEDIELKFNDSVLQKFFDAHYTGEMINQAISDMDRFRFKSDYRDGLNTGSYADKISDIIVPKDIDEILKQKSQLFLTKGNYPAPKEYKGYTITGKEAVDSYDENIEFIKADGMNAVYGYIPAKFSFNNDIFGETVVPLVLKVRITGEELKKLLRQYISTALRLYSEDNVKELVKVTDITHDFDLAKEVMSGYLTDGAEEKIVRLNEIRRYVTSSGEILNYCKKLTEENYNSYLERITEDNLETALKITEWIPKFLNKSSVDVLAKLFDKLKVNDELKIYEIFVANGYDMSHEKSLLLTFVNPVESALKDRNRETKDKALSDLRSYDGAIEKLKEITSVRDCKDYKYDMGEISRKDFKETYKKADLLKNSVQVFKSENSDRFERYDGFMKIFTGINDYINMEEEASKHPNNLKQDLIEKKIKAGEYLYVLVNLSARLEFILKSKYDLNGNLFPMLKDAESKELIDVNILKDLDRFRENRNAVVHSGKQNSDYTADDLRRWSKEIFDLERDKNGKDRNGADTNKKDTNVKNNAGNNKTVNNQLENKDKNNGKNKNKKNKNRK